MPGNEARETESLGMSVSDAVHTLTRVVSAEVEYVLHLGATGE